MCTVTQGLGCIAILVSSAFKANAGVRQQIVGYFLDTWIGMPRTTEVRVARSPSSELGEMLAAQLPLWLSASSQ